MITDLEALLRRSAEAVKAMPPEQREAMLREQGRRWAAAEMSMPPAKYRWVKGVKVYDSYEDYCNG